MFQKTIQSLLALMFIISISFAQQAPKIRVEMPQGSKPWTSLEVKDSETRFQFAVVTDRTGGHRPGVFMDGVNKLNLIQPAFVMSVGDLIEGYTENLTELNRQWEEFDGFVDQLQMPFFYVPGNHDYTNPVMAKLWEERLGPNYYHFVYKDVLFLCVNSEGSVKDGGRSAQFNEEQLEYFSKALNENQDVKWTFVFLHKPLWTYNEESTDHWSDFEKLLGQREHTVFAGHHHHYVKYEQNNGKYFMLATTGGGSRLRGPAMGEFDHVVWVTVTDKGPIIANLMLEGIWDENIVPDKQWEFVSTIRNEQPLKIDPLFISTDGFKMGETMLKITNDSDVPMEATLTFSQGKDLMPGWVDFQKTIEPNSVEMVKLPISVNEPLSTQDPTPLKIHGIYSYRPEAMPEVELSSQHLFGPVELRELKWAPKPYKADGNLSEWSDFQFEVNDPYVIANPFSHKGDEDASFSFDIHHDKDFIYLAAKVMDDELILDEDLSAWIKDGLMFQLDPRSPEKSANHSSRWAPVNIAMSPPEKKGGETQLYWQNRSSKGIVATAKHVEGGYHAEVAVPISALDSIQGGKFEHLRVNVIVSDIDKAGSHSTRMAWKPVWESKDNIIGSGMFIRREGMGKGMKQSGEKE